jgi:threonylcarbamoyladenosine tRNA methylthiotransferase MtaB
MLQLKNKTYNVTVYGCRTNQYEGEALAALLEEAGAVRSASAADIEVIVTCTITAAADRKCRKQIRKLRRENPHAVIAVCGCYAQNVPEAERELIGADIIIGNRLKNRLAEALSRWFADAGSENSIALFDRDILSDDSWDSLALDRPRMHGRAFLKVQDGCDHYCSYCIVPYVRGRPVSRRADEVAEEARRIVASGCKEIILTGIHLGLYDDLPGLVRRVGNISGLKRLRFGSIEPFAVNDDLLDAIADTETFCPHLHLPLQSGDDGVLASMRRGYTAEDFRTITKKIRRRLNADIHLSTDLMIGFPAEDDAAFESSLRFVEEIGFGKVHVFPFSPRAGTDAAKMRVVPEKKVRERVLRALALADKLHERYCSKWIGKSVSVLVEEKRAEAVVGLTPNYMRVAAQDRGYTLSEEIDVTPERYANSMLLTGGLSLSHRAGLEIPEFL